MVGGQARSRERASWRERSRQAPSASRRSFAALVAHVEFAGEGERSTSQHEEEQLTKRGTVASVKLRVAWVAVASLLVSTPAFADDDSAKEAKPQLATLHLEIDVRDARIAVNGHELSTPSVSDPSRRANDVSVDAGHVTVDVNALGYHPKHIDLDLEAGDSARVVVVLDPLPISKRPIWPGLVFSGVGLSAIGVGIGGLAASSGASRDGDENGARGFRALGITGFVVGGASVLAAVLYTMWPSPKMAKRPRATIELIPSFGETHGLWLTGQF